MKRIKIVSQLFVVVFLGLLVAPALMGQEKPMLDRYVDKYWGKKREIKVIQKRLFMKDGRHEFSFYSGVLPNDEFLVYFPAGLRYDYFISEDLAIELFGTYLYGMETGLGDFLGDRKQGFGIKIHTHLPQKLKWTGGLEGLWSPIHGKVGVFTRSLVHFDWHLALGAGAIGTEVATREEGGQAKSKTDVAANFGSGIRMYLNDWFALRLEYRHFFYAAEQGGVSYPVEISLGASLFTK